MSRSVPWPQSVRVTSWLDLVLCAAVFATGVAGQVAATNGAAVDSGPADVVLVLLAGVVSAILWWRRTHPFATLSAAVVIVVVAATVSPPGLFGVQIGLVFVIACFALGAWSERRRLVVVVGALLVLVTVGGSAGNGGGLLPATAVALALVALPIVAGTAARSRRRYLDEVERRLAEAERGQEERARLAIQEERTRIARELHDVVAHHVSLIGVQAGAARASLGSSPDLTREALASIERSSRAAVGEMRQIVDVLAPLDPASRSPQPSLVDLDELVGRWRDAGYRIAVDVDADVGSVPPALSSSCYRVVEEALTNVARHSRARSVSVQVRPLSGGLEVAVHDPGPGEAHPPTSSAADLPPAGGRGLVGMAERSALFGGSLAAGPTPDGGFLVVASMPGVEPS